jgi:hypothetical protein
VEDNTISKTKKARMSRKLKAILIVLFDIHGIVVAQWVPSDQVVNQHHLTEVLTKLRERVRTKRPEVWRNCSILHQANAPAHNTLPVKQVLANKNVTALKHPPYSLPATSTCSQISSQCSKEPILCWQKV